MCEHVPALVAQALVYASHDAAAISRHVDTVEDQEVLRAQLSEQGLVGFIPNGARLARASGASDEPMPSCIPFESPAGLQAEVTLPHVGRLVGMGLRQAAVYVCLGGGFHGKSTLLAALATGMYNHIPGDGREYVSVSQNAASIRSEDGRPVGRVDIASFITNLPDRSDTR